MSAPMVNHVLVNKSLHLTIKSSIGLLRRQNKLSATGKLQERYYISQKINEQADKMPNEQKEVDTDGQHLEADDFFGVTEFYRSIPPRTNPSPSLEKDVLKTKYGIQEQNQAAKQFDVMKVPYGIVRLDAGVAAQYRKDEQDGQRRGPRRRRESRNMKTEIRKEISHNQILQPNGRQFSENLAKNSGKSVSVHEFESLHNFSRKKNSFQKNLVKDLNNSDFCLSIDTESQILNRTTEEYRIKDNNDYSSKGEMNKKSFIFIDRDVKPSSDESTSFKKDRVNFIDEAYFGTYKFSDDAKTTSDNDGPNEFDECSPVNSLDSQDFTLLNEELNHVDQNYFGSYDTNTKIKTQEKEDATKSLNSEPVIFDNNIGKCNIFEFETDNIDKVNEDFSHTIEPCGNNTADELKGSIENEDNFIDSQYFGAFNGKDSQTTKPSKSDMSEIPLLHGKSVNSYGKEDNYPRNFTESELPLLHGRPVNEYRKGEKKESTSIKGENFSSRSSKGDNLKVNYSKEDILDGSYLKSEESYSNDSTYTSMNDISKSENRFQKNEKTVMKRRDKFSQSKDDLFSEGKSQKMTTAEEAARKIRKELNEPAKEETKESKPKSKTLRQSKEIRKTLDDMTSSEVASLLYKNVVYNRGDVVGLNKPYGLAVHDGPGIHVSVGHCLEKLKNHMDPDIQKLYMVNHLDKDMTGVVLLAKTEQMATRLKDAFKAKQVVWKYFLVTKGVPKPEQGIIDIPMAEGKVEGKYRMTLRPQGFSNQKDTVKAVTQYKVLTSTGNTALVECTPVTAVKHQIRAHMFYGLNTPIVGDHKYSHFTKIAPQKLFPEMLTGLKIRQAEVRHLPLHLHARSLIIPEFEDGRNLYVHCRIPDFFVTNMKKLKLNFKEFL